MAVPLPAHSAVGCVKFCFSLLSISLSLSSTSICILPLSISVYILRTHLDVYIYALTYISSHASSSAIHVFGVISSILVRSVCLVFLFWKRNRCTEETRVGGSLNRRAGGIAGAMAVATPQVELWRALQVNTDSVDKQKNGWGEDRQKVLQMMLGHFNHHHQKNSATLDLLGLPGSAAHGSDLLELDEEQCLPSGWEKVLDLKTGAVYYVNSATGSRAAVEVGGHGASKHQMLTCSWGEKPVRRGGGDDDSRNGAGRIGTLDLRLNLWASEDDWNLRTTTIQDAGSRRGSHSVSESSNMSSTVSPSASSSPSSCISSERTSSNDMLCGACAAAAADQAEIAMKNSNSTGFFNNNITLTSAAAAAMVLVGCPRCLMYVILSREDPRCPKCKSSVLLDFPHAESSKRPRTSA